MITTKKNYKDKIKLPLTLLFIYILLFEFILPVNNILPKPSLLWESFLSLWQDYSIVYPLIISVSVVYVSVVIGFIIMNFIAGKIIGILRTYSGMADSLSFVKYFPLLALILLVDFWFPVSLPAEYVFGIISVLIILSAGSNNQITSVGRQYVESAESLGIKREIIDSKIIWKSLLPGLLGKTEKYHLELWGIILFFEFVNFNFGLGSVYFRMLNYSDFSGAVALTLLLSLIIFAGNHLLVFLKNKIVFWET